MTYHGGHSGDSLLMNVTSNSASMPWPSEVHTNSRKTKPVSWGPMGSHGVPWGSMGLCRDSLGEAVADLQTATWLSLESIRGYFGDMPHRSTCYLPWYLPCYLPWYLPW